MITEGKRIVELQMSMALVNISRPPTQKIGQDEYGRYPFDHPALDGLLNLTAPVKAEILDKRRLYALSDKYGLLPVLRWRPKKVYLPTLSMHRSMLTSTGRKLDWIRVGSRCCPGTVWHCRSHLTRKRRRGGESCCEGEDSTATWDIIDQVP